MKFKNLNALGWAIILASLIFSFAIDQVLRYHIELKAGLGVVVSFVVILVGIGLALRYGVKQGFKK